MVVLSVYDHLLWAANTGFEICRKAHAQIFGLREGGGWRKAANLFQAPLAEFSASFIGAMPYFYQEK
ncbi:MAG: hypothetical protein ABSG60_00495 [Terracidiphilus sp.]|jgi:hypothetical protein